MGNMLGWDAKNTLPGCWLVASKACGLESHKPKNDGTPRKKRMIESLEKRFEKNIFCVTVIFIKKGEKINSEFRDVTLWGHGPRAK